MCFLLNQPDITTAMIR